MSPMIVVGHTSPQDFAEFDLSDAEGEAARRMEQEIEAKRTPKGGWNRTQFAKWGPAMAAAKGVEAGIDPAGAGTGHTLNLSTAGEIAMTTTLDTKDRARLDSLFHAAACAVRADRPAALSVIADAERALKRVVRRAEVPAGYERMTFTQDKGATVEASVRLLADTAFQIETHRGQELDIALEIYESAAGALLAVSASTLPGGTGREDVRVTVVPPTDDVLAMRIAVMNAFDWSVYARSMARKMGWNLIVDVD